MKIGGSGFVREAGGGGFLLGWAGDGYLADVVGDGAGGWVRDKVVCFWYYGGGFSKIRNWSG